jgi:hypothetical protein
MVSLSHSNGTLNSNTVNGSRETRVHLSSTSTQAKPCRAAECAILPVPQALKKQFVSSGVRFASQEGQDSPQDLPRNSQEMIHFGAVENGLPMPFHKMEEEEENHDNNNIEGSSEALKSRESQIQLVFGDFNDADSSVSLERTESGSWKRKSYHPSGTPRDPVIHSNLKKQRFQKSPTFHKTTDNPIAHEKKGRNQHMRESPAQEELDARRLFQRQKQIDFGKNTLGYDEYLRQVPR